MRRTLRKGVKNGKSQRTHEKSERKECPCERSLKEKTKRSKKKEKKETIAFVDYPKAGG